MHECVHPFIVAAHFTMSTLETSFAWSREVGQQLPNQASPSRWSPARLQSHRHDILQPFPPAATFSLELWRCRVFETYSLPCHRNGGEKEKQSMKDWSEQTWRDSYLLPCWLHIRLCRTQEQMQLCFTELSGRLSIAPRNVTLCSSLIDFTFSLQYLQSASKACHTQFEFFSSSHIIIFLIISVSCRAWN